MRFSIITFVLATILLIGLMPVNGLAVQTESNVIYFDDGYLVISIAVDPTRAANTRVAYKTYRYYDSADNVEWEAKLNASYTYDGTTSSRTSASCTVTVYDSKCYEISNTTKRSGNTATTQLTMGSKFLGITVSIPEYTITPTCDEDVNLS